MRYDNYNKNNN